jgi:site-specific DNA recombinase
LRSSGASAARGTGILNNAVFAGRLEWNRCSDVKDPSTGRRVARPNQHEQREVVAVPDLRIVDDALRAARERQGAITFEIGRNAAGAALNRAHRRQFLLSGLLVCGCCGGGYTIMGKDRYGHGVNCRWLRWQETPTAS